MQSSVNRNLFGILVIKKLLVEFCLTVFKSVSIPRTFCEDHLKLSHVYFMNVYIELFRNVHEDIHEWLDRAVGKGEQGLSRALPVHVGAMEDLSAL